MQAITIRQPWAHFIIHGPKRVENRTWPASYRGPLAIHASSSPRSLPGLCRQLGTRDGLFHEHVSAEFARIKLEDLAFGAILGIVEMVDCRRVEDLDEPDPWAEGPWCHIYRDPRPLDRPIPCLGALSLWYTPAWLRIE